MKKIESKDLVIGQEYYDIPDLEDATVLKFVGVDEDTNSLQFEHVGGYNYYCSYNGVILLGTSNIFYQP